MNASALDHLAIAVDGWQLSARILIQELGGCWLQGYALASFQPAQVGYKGPTKVELIAPGDPAATGFVSRFLRTNGGNGPQHLTFLVDNADTALKRASELGFMPAGVRINRPVWREFFLLPQQTGLGILVQLVEAGDLTTDLSAAGGLTTDLSAVRAEPFYPEITEPTGTIRAIHLEVEDLAAANRALAHLLGGEARQHEGGFIYQWSRGAELVVRRSHRSGVRMLQIEGNTHISSTRFYPELGLEVSFVACHADLDSERKERKNGIER